MRTTALLLRIIVTSSYGHIICMVGILQSLFDLMYVANEVRRFIFHAMSLIS